MNWFLKTRNFVKKNEKYISPIALFGGFIIDSLTLQRIDLPFENIILGSYLLLSGVLVFLISLIDSKESRGKFLNKIRPFLGIALLFVFGGIFSGFFIFYTRSASLASSWPFLLILLTVMIGTEYLKKYFTRMTVQVLVFYFALFSYLIFVVPIILKMMGHWIFILSGIISLALMFAYIKGLKRFLGDRFDYTRKNIIKGVIGIFVLVNILYFTNIIPPIPLSLKNADVFHSVQRQNGNYVVLDEKKNFWDYITIHEKVHIKKGEPLYLFSSVFAPTKLNTKIVHEWQYRTEKGKWITSSKIPFSISGGRDGGYRGYSFKAGLTEGRWRVDIKTPRGQLIGRKVFVVKFVEEEQEKVSKVR
jgi:hypothetical protein